MTLVYAASGLAVNHFRDWNPNYEVRHETVTLGALPLGEPGSDAWARALLPLLDVNADYRGTFRPDPATVDVFVDGGTVSVELESREATVETVRPRPLLGPANALHLNEAGGLWTWVADLYAAALLLLALTGLFVIKGRKGITGRGAWLTAIGVGVPLLLAILVLRGSSVE
ncbi:MAG: PepSY-associated TM helix domain-containing protein [Gemmatimonadota bacterium]